MPPSVLIAGAGPTGLTVALALRKSGVDVRIVDKATKPMVGQRGAGIMPRTLELQSILGTLPDILEQAGSMGQFRMYPEAPYVHPTKTVTMRQKRDPTPTVQYPNPVLLWQQRHETILRSHLSKYGVEVEYSTELKTFEQTADMVSATLAKRLDGRESVETIEVPYLISAEGAHSVVRKGLGLTFLGETTTVHFVLSDIEVLEGLDRDYAHMFGNPVEKMFTFMHCEHPPSKYFYFFATGSQVDYKEASSSRDALIRTFYELTGRTDIKFGNMLSLSLYTPNIRMVNKFSEGRCFVAGDTAHVHSPAGGQGLNSGIQDAMNLAWKLAAVIKGQAPERLLESYTAERLLVIAAMLGKTRDLHDRSFSNDETGWSREGAIDMLGVNYRGSPIVVDTFHAITKDTPVDPYMSGPEIHAGDRAPDAIDLVDVNGANTLSLYKIFGYTYHTALIFAQDPRDIARLVSHLATYDNLKTVVVLPSTSGSSISLADTKADVVVRDSGGHAYNAYVPEESSRPVTVALVRPDAYIGALVNNIEGVQKYFAAIRNQVS